MLSKNSNSKHITFFAILILLLIVLFFLDLVLGSVKIPVNEILNILTKSESSRQEWLTIVIDFRLPKAITAIIAGAALSVSGLQMQTIFRNPLAGPYVLGISSGASLGVAVLVLGFSSFFTANQLNFMGNWAVVVSACIGSGLILFLILTLSFRIKDIMTILILGILFGSAATAVVSILQYFSNESMLKAFIVWTMGSLGSVSHSQLNILLPSIILGLVISLASTKILNAMLLGESYAKSMGVNIKLSRILVFISTSILAGTITAFCGPIGFIGIAVPHLTRIIFKTTNHNFLIPGSILIGSIIMLLSDIISRLPGYNATLPINSVTALLGIPIVIFIIVRKHKLSSLM